MILPYTQFVTEAKISSANFSKATDLIISILKKRTGSTFYRFGGKNGYTETKKGVGVLYLYDRNKAIRFNLIGNDFSSITLWNNFKLGKSGDYTLNFGDANVVSAVNSIVDAIIKPGVGTREFYVESNEMLNEASRVSPEEFYVMINDNLFPNENIGAVTWERLSNIATRLDKQIPTVVRKCQVGKGKVRTYDLTMLMNVPNASKPAQSAEPIYYVKVTAQDPETKKFMSVKGDARASDILKTIDDAVNNPSPDLVKKMGKDPNTLFGHMKALTQVVARGKRNSLVITGGAGIGKSHSVFETVAGEGLVKNKDWYLVKGKITTATLYQMLYQHRDGTLLVFDDADSVWGDQDAANILKAALDSYDERHVSWYSARTVNISKMNDADKAVFYSSLDLKIAADPGDPKIKYPSEFEYRGRIVFISNLPVSKMDAAVLNRSTKIDMDLTTDEIFARIESILPHLGKKDVPLEAKREIFDFIKQHTKSGKLESPSIRTYVGAEDLYSSGIENWRELMEYI